MLKPTFDSVDRIEIAKPCPASWNAMVGDDRVRHCTSCDQNVYNLAGMTREEARALIGREEGRPCIRLFRRRDGTVLTKDCPVGLAAFRRKVAGLASTVAAGFMMLLGGLGWTATQGGTRLPIATPTCDDDMIMGAMVAPVEMGEAEVMGR